jgi:hypothetical protein
MHLCVAIRAFKIQFPTPRTQYPQKTWCTLLKTSESSIREKIMEGRCNKEIIVVQNSSQDPVIRPGFFLEISPKQHIINS